MAFAVCAPGRGGGKNEQGGSTDPPCRRRMILARRGCDSSRGRSSLRSEDSLHHFPFEIEAADADALPTIPVFALLATDCLATRGCFADCGRTRVVWELSASLRLVSGRLLTIGLAFSATLTFAAGLPVVTSLLVVTGFLLTTGLLITGLTFSAVLTVATTLPLTTGLEFSVFLTSATGWAVGIALAFWA